MRRLGTRELLTGGDEDRARDQLMLQLLTPAGSRRRGDEVRQSPAGTTGGGGAARHQSLRIALAVIESFGPVPDPLPPTGQDCVEAWDRLEWLRKEWER